MPASLNEPLKKNSFAGIFKLNTIVKTFFVSLLSIFIFQITPSNAANITGYSATNNSLTISWSAWNGTPGAADNPTQYQVCWKIHYTAPLICNQYTSPVLTGQSYTISNLAADTSFKVRVKARTKWKVGPLTSIDWRTLDTVVISTSGDTQLTVTNALSNAFDLQMTHTGFTNWNTIRLCYKKASLWTLPFIDTVCGDGIDLNNWSPVKKKGYYEIAPSSSGVTNYTLANLHPNCPYKIVAYGLTTGLSITQKKIGEVQFDTEHSAGQVLGWLRCHAGPLVDDVVIVIDLYNQIVGDPKAGSNTESDAEVSEAALGDFGRLAIVYRDSEDWGKYLQSLANHYGSKSIIEGVAAAHGEKAVIAYAKLVELAKKFGMPAPGDWEDEMATLLATSPRIFERWQAGELKDAGLDLRTFIEKAHGREFLEQVQQAAMLNTPASNAAETPSVTGTTACVANLPKGDPFLNLRSEPSGSAKVLKQMTAGTPMLVLGNRGNWSNVQLVIDGKQGPSGWVASRFTSLVKAAEECAGDPE